MAGSVDALLVYRHRPRPSTLAAVPLRYPLARLVSVKLPCTPPCHFSRYPTYLSCPLIMHLNRILVLTTVTTHTLAGEHTHSQDVPMRCIADNGDVADFCALRRTNHTNARLTILPRVLLSRRLAPRTTGNTLFRTTYTTCSRPSTLTMANKESHALPPSRVLGLLFQHPNPFPVHPCI